MLSKLPARGVLCLCLILLAAVMLWPGCTRERTITRAQLQNILICWLAEWGGTAMLASDPIADPDRSELEISWGDSSRVFSEEYVYPGYIGFDDPHWLTPETAYAVQLTSNVGGCEGTIVLPGAVGITRPSWRDTLPLGVDVQCVWTPAEGADGYRVLYYADGYDSSGHYIGSCGEYDDFIWVRTVSLVIAASFFDLPGAAYYEVYLDVFPMAGPAPEPGASGNMSGSVRGFLVGYGTGDFMLFYVGVPVGGDAVQPHRREAGSKEALNSYMRALGIEN